MLWENRGNKKDDYLTPPELIRALGKFDLDPCSLIKRPWDTADNHLTVEDNGLLADWSGRVWLNPPYGKEARKWLAKMVAHGNGILLIFVRTETKVFHEYVWGRANGVFFLRGRLRFYDVEGNELKMAMIASCLVAYGKENAEILRNSLLDGFYLDIR